jgi:HEAT repeat protein
MRKAGSVLASALFAAAFILPCSAQAQYSGARGSADSMARLEKAAPNALNKGQSDEDLIKEAKRKIADADPRIRVEGLEKLRFITATTPEVNQLLLRGINDGDVRVRIKATDVLGAQGISDAVPVMTQALFLRETVAVEKLHLVAALGRIGDSRGTLSILEFLDETDDPPSRGTAVFALGEIGDPRANDKLIQIVTNDKNAIVRKLAQEAIEKIDGELPNRHQEELAAEKQKIEKPTDEKLSKLREMDAQFQQQKY